MSFIFSFTSTFIFNTDIMNAVLMVTLCFPRIMNYSFSELSRPSTAFYKRPVFLITKTQRMCATISFKPDSRENTRIYFYTNLI